MYRIQSTRVLRSVFLALFLFGLLAYPCLAAIMQPNAVEKARQLAQDSGAYSFIANVDEVLLPRATPLTIGQSDERINWRIEGEVMLPDFSLMQIKVEGKMSQPPPVTIVQDGDESYVQVGDERKTLDSFTGIVGGAATQDFLNYLKAAINIHALEPEWEGDEQFSRYAFEIDNQKFAQYTRQVMARQLQGQIPAGMQITIPEYLLSMVGTGELWVDSAGLPRRQVLDIDMPAASEFYDARLHMVIDFHEFGATSHDLLTTIRASLPVIFQPSSLILYFTCLLLAGMIIAYRRHSRQVYIAISILLILSVSLSPLLETLSIVRFQEQQAQAAVDSKIVAALGLSANTDQEAAEYERQQAETVDHPLPAAGIRAYAPFDQPQTSCSSGSPGVDTDSDGLNDQAEYCLGTDPFYIDSDRDLITDTLELTGFDYGGKHWTADPFKIDSNEDGVPDFSEWPAPVGEAPGVDFDGDGVPNLLDDDNDDDLVPDRVDLSIYYRGTYTGSFSLDSQSGSFDGYRYIEIQLQPENQDSLRYPNSFLDWPYDNAGQLQDLDYSEKDIQLQPVLKVRTDQAPERVLAENYGLSAFIEDGKQYLYAPLLPVSDGGQYVAFYTKIPYGPATPDIHWEKASLVWIVQMNVDQNGYEMSTKNMPIQVYSGGNFRLTGLQIVMSKGTQSAILGTPSMPDDDTQLFNLLFGLSSTFLNNQTPDLQTIYNRFTGSNTPLVEKWGVTTPVTVDLSPVYAHLDEGLASMPGRLSDLLRSYSQQATLLIAGQDRIGTYNISDRGSFSPDNRFEVNLADVPITIQRSLKLATYAYQYGQWKAQALDETLDMLTTRYADMNAILADLQVQYPDLTENDLKMTLFLFYSTWSAGQSRIFSLGGRDLAPQIPLAQLDPEVYSQFNRPEAGSLPAYLIEAAGLGLPGSGLRVDDPSGKWSYLRARENFVANLGVTGSHFDLYNINILPESEANKFGPLAKIIGDYTRWVSAVNMVVWAKTGMNLGGKVISELGEFGFTSNMKFASRTMAKIGLVVGIGFIWVGFGTTTDWENSMEVKQAVASAISATAIAVVLFVICANPIVAVIVGVVAVLDLILFFAVDFSIFDTLTQALANASYSSNILTKLTRVNFISPRSGLVDESLGFVKGNRFRVSDLFWSQIETTPYGHQRHVENSSAYGWFYAFNSVPTVSLAKLDTEPACSGPQSMILGGLRVCTNEVTAEFNFDAATRDMALWLYAYLHAETLYEDCTLNGSICWGSYRTTDDLPKDPQPNIIFLDVLPSTVTGLWNWTAPPQVLGHEFNPDLDGDGLSNIDEQNLSLNSDQWDTDGDGLQDSVENEQRETLGADPLQADTDGDGLDDGFEFQHNTRINQQDSDNDGLTDADEVYHLYPDGSWDGGWLVTLPDSSLTVRIYPDPRNPDSDGDGLDDAAERRAGTSPFAYNGAPHLSLEAAPLADGPSASGVYVKPGDTVVYTLTLSSYGPYPVASVLSLCLPAFLTDIQVGAMQGDRTPPNNPALSSCQPGNTIPLAWDFSGQNNLLWLQTASVTVTARVNPALPGTAVGDTLASLPYMVSGTPSDITRHVVIAADKDNPQVVLLKPAHNAVLGGGISTYVIGGLATDETSWVRRVELDLPAGGGTVTASGTSLWSYAWDLPAGDGSYVLQARAYDYLGRVSIPESVNVTVDNTPPWVTLDPGEGDFVSGMAGNTGVITVTLTGSAGDNLSGLDRIQLSTDGKPWRDAPLDGGVWRNDWTLPSSDSAQGEHTVTVRAVDRAGNVSASLSRTILVDVVPPTDELADRTFLKEPPHVITGQPVELTGTINDVGRAPNPSRPEELVGVLGSLSDATIWLGPDSAVENNSGVFAAWIGDFNGDRLADLAAGFPAAAGGAGKVAIAYGQAGGWPAPADMKLLSDSASSFIGPPGAMLGTLVKPAGDVNGDGYDDLLIGDATNNKPYVVFGRPRPVGRDILLTGSQSASWSVIDLTGLGSLFALNPAGDVNGDGCADLLLAVGGINRIFLLPGQPGAWPDLVDLDLVAAAYMDANPSVAALTGVGDLDGDQYDDFAITQSGTVYVYRGSGLYTAYANLSLALSEADIAFASADPLPQVVALGDVNLDHLDDFIFSNGSVPRLVYGGVGLGLSTFDFAGLSPAASGFLAAAGDVNNDGYADVLVGNAVDDAYLFLGGSLSSPAATITGVESATSAPYAAGADLNSDGSSDLVLIPNEQAASGLDGYSPAYGDMPFVDPASLPRVPSAGAGDGGEKEPLLGMSAPNAVLHVDDDGCSGCYTTIQSAVNAALPGDVIIVNPGVYDSFLIDGKDNLAVRGVHADAVFVDGSAALYGIKIQNAKGVRLEQMTVRHTDTAIDLDHAGVGGESDPALAVQLQSLLVYDFTLHAISMDRFSSVVLTRCTLAGGGDHIFVYGPPSLEIDLKWSTTITDSRAVTEDGGGLLAAGEKVYVLPGNGSSSLYAYDPAANSWTAEGELASVPGQLSGGSALTSDGAGKLFALRAPMWEALGTGLDFAGEPSPRVNTIVIDSDGTLYTGGYFNRAGELVLGSLASWDGHNWSDLLGGVHNFDGTDSEVTAMAVDSSDRLYVGGNFDYTAGGYSPNFAVWDGTFWYSLGNGPNLEWIYDIAVDSGGAVYVCGYSAGEYWLKRWNGINWTTLLSGAPIIFALDADALGSIYVAGGFTDLGGLPGADYIAKWNGSSWEALGNGASGAVWDVDYDQGNVYITGGGTSCGGACRWNGTTWDPLGSYLLDKYPYRIVADGDGAFVVGGGEGSQYLLYWDGSNWVNLPGSENTMFRKYRALAVRNSGEFYAGGDIQSGGEMVNCITRWARPLYQYDLPADSWSELVPFPETSINRIFTGNSASLASDGANTLYLFAGDGSGSFYQYDVAAGTWTDRQDLPANAGSGASLAFAGGAVYALRGGAGRDFYRYLPGSNTWETLAPVPDVAVIDSGAALAWDGRDWLYALPGGYGKQFLRYHLPFGQWQVLGDGDPGTAGDDDALFYEQAGAGLALVGNNLYAVAGGGAGPLGMASLYRYNPVGVYYDHLAFNQVAFVVDDTASSGPWLNLIFPPEDFNITWTGSAWVGGSSTVWSPQIVLGGESYTHAQAAFLDPSRDGYRLTEGSAISAGYHTFRAAAMVAGSGEEFTSIQAALLSGANRVSIRAGIYPQTFYLVSGVSVAGSGDDTIIQPPSPGSGAIVTAEGVVGSSLSRLTFQGEGLSGVGLRVEDDAKYIAFSRSVVRGFATGIAVDGYTTDLEIFNNTIVENTDGLAGGVCTPLDVRNTIFAFNAGIGLWTDVLSNDTGTYQPVGGCGTVSRLHTYNLFWRNGADLSPSEPLPGELFLDPLFEDRSTGNFHLTKNSPAIDSGSPGDPYPLGAGERVDIGYLEYSRAVFYADDNYCATCANDGLTWQVDAFNVIQEALNAADNYLSLHATPGLDLYVGVGPGIYYERINIPSYVHLVGSGADRTTINGDRGSAVTFQGAVQAEVRDFTFCWALDGNAAVYVTGGSNTITITRNIIRNNDNGVGIRFDGRSSGLVSHNTIVRSMVGVLSDSAGGSGSWATVENNIIVYSDSGLQTVSGGQIFNDYNLLYNPTDYDDQAGTGLAEGENDLTGSDPQFVDWPGEDYRLLPVSPAMNAASPDSEPLSGGARADMGYYELFAAPLAVFLGKEGNSTAIGSSGAAQVEVGVSFVPDHNMPITATLPLEWSAVTLASPGQTYSYWSTVYTPSQDGLYRFYSRAGDVVGNQEEDEINWYEGAFIADSVEPVLAWSPASPPTDVSSPVELRAFVSDYAAGQFSVKDVYFVVDGNRVDAAWAGKPWSSGQPRLFQARVPLTNGLHTAQAFAVDKAGNTGQTALLNLNVISQDPADTTPPMVAITSPAAGSWFTSTVPIAGTAEDELGGSGLASVEVSLDGGISWLPASVSEPAWNLEWEVPFGQEFVSYPLQARATDRAGNTASTAQIPITVDNVPPGGLEPVIFSALPGTHFDLPTTLVITWTAPVDGSGMFSTLLAADQVTGTIPSVAVAGSTASVMLSLPGDWYIHIAARDLAGNLFILQYGPWHVGNFADFQTACADRRQTIRVDGLLDLQHNEWLDTERLDDDERPFIASSLAEVTSLYTSWDGEAFYLGWQGAWWALDGELWAYFDTQPGGSTTGIETSAGPVELPYPADLSLNITGPAEGNLWQYSEGQWSAAGGLEFAQGDRGGTEIRIPWNIESITGLNLLAFAVSDAIPNVSDSHVWSAFPTGDPLSDSPLESYYWDDLCSVVEVNSGQPHADNVSLALSSPQLPASLWRPSDLLTYEIDVTNHESHPVQGLQLQLAASPGLAFWNVEGASCANCGANNYWLLSVPQVEAQSHHTITVRALLGTNLESMNSVANYVILKSGSQILAEDSLSHRVDGTKPKVTITDPTGQVLPIGPFTLYGTADDGIGSGMARVQFSTDGYIWQDATGLQSWSAQVIVPERATSFTVWVRAVDRFGLVAVISAIYAIDSNPPMVTVSLPPVLTGEAAEIGGTAMDGEGLVTQVEVQLDGAASPWLPATVYQPKNGQQSWRFTWVLPLEDGVVHTLRARSYDAVGNISNPTAWLTTTVDTIAPQVTADQLVFEAVLEDYLSGGGGPVLSGTVSDNSGIASLVIHMYDPIGNVYNEPVTPNLGAWQFTPSLSHEVSGNYLLWVEATDTAGNKRLSGQFYLVLRQETWIIYLPLLSNTR